MKAKIVTDRAGRFYGIRINCPGCGQHILPVNWLPDGMEESEYAKELPHWGFNGDFAKPTLTPSILSRGGANDVACHSFVTDGRIQFLADSNHALAGQTVELPELPE